MFKQKYIWLFEKKNMSFCESARLVLWISGISMKLNENNYCFNIYDLMNFGVGSFQIGNYS